MQTTPQATQPVQRMMIQIFGMSCDGCVRQVHRALAQLPGVQVERVEVGRATVAFDPARCSRDDIADAVIGAGFVPRWS